MTNAASLMAMRSAIAVLLLTASLQAQSESSFSLTVFFVDAPQPGQPTRIWLQIENHTQHAEALCRSGWGYSWLSADQHELDAVEAQASLHGCGDDDHDPLWLLLPGESRFDSYEVTGPSSPDSTLEVSVELQRTKDRTPITLEWKGRVADAIANGRRARR